MDAFARPFALAGCRAAAGKHRFHATQRDKIALLERGCFGQEALAREPMIRDQFTHQRARDFARSRARYPWLHPQAKAQTLGFVVQPRVDDGGTNIEGDRAAGRRRGSSPPAPTTCDV